MLLGQPIIASVGAAIYALGVLGIMEFMETQRFPLSDFAAFAFIFTGVGAAMACLSNALSWITSAGITITSLWLWGRVRLEVLLAITPLLGFLLWYGYDHLIPDGGFPAGAHDYAHGLTWIRFGKAWLIEIVGVCIYWLPLRKVRQMS